MQASTSLAGRRSVPDHDGGEHLRDGVPRRAFSGGSVCNPATIQVWIRNLLELELTESVLMKRAESTESILKALRASGIQLAVDDFGTGYSSLSYLRKFPLDALEIDQSFVRQITGTADESTIVTAVISMGRSLKLRVVADGVETQEAADISARPAMRRGARLLFQPAGAPLSSSPNYSRTAYAKQFSPERLARPASAGSRFASRKHCSAAKHPRTDCCYGPDLRRVTEWREKMV